MRVMVDHDRCTGHARCAAVAPELYELDEMGASVISEADVPLGLEEAARRGARSCPERAIAVVED